MDYIKIRFDSDLDAMDPDGRSRVDALFNMVSPSFRRSRRAWSPPVDVYETPEDILVVAELAGVNDDDIRIEVGHRNLKIYGIRRPGLSEQDMRYRMAEISYGYFERSLALPLNIDRDQVEATYTNGILQVRIRKTSHDVIHKIRIRGG